MRILFIIIVCFITKNFQLYSQAFYGITIDNKLSLQKNRIGCSLFKQLKKKDKLGISINYNYSNYNYPSNVTHLNNLGTGYIANDRYRPPYSKELGTNSSSFIRGFDIGLFNNFRIKTYRNSSLGLKILFGYVGLLDTYTTYHFGERRIGNHQFHELEGSMYFTYLIWCKNIGIEPSFGATYFWPTALYKGGLSYDPLNPFTGTELEIGISFYYQRKSKQR